MAGDLVVSTITQAILEINATLAVGNPFVVLGPALDDGDYTPAEGVGIVINAINSGAVNFPVEPGHAYTFSLGIENVFQIVGGEGLNGLWYRNWDDGIGLWSSWQKIADVSAIPNENSPPPLTTATDGRAKRVNYAVDNLTDITFSGCDTWRIMYVAKGDGVTSLKTINLNGHGSVSVDTLGSLQLAFSVHITVNQLRVSKTGSGTLSLSMVAVGVK